MPGVTDNVVVGSETYATEANSGVHSQKFKAAGASAAAANAVTITTSATTIRLAANANRRNVVMRNTGSAVMYVHPTSGQALTNGLPINPNEVFESDYTGAFYVAVVSGTGTFVYWEESNT